MRGLLAAIVVAGMASVFAAGPASAAPDAPQRLPPLAGAAPGSLPLSRLVHLPLPERPDGHLRQLQRPAGPRGLRVSSGPIRAQHRDRRRIAVQVDVLLPPDRPGFLGAHASHQAYHDAGMQQRGGTPRILQPCVPLQCRRRLP